MLTESFMFFLVEEASDVIRKVCTGDTFRTILDLSPFRNESNGR